jgi:hypothetical protein
MTAERNELLIRRLIEEAANPGNLEVLNEVAEGEFAQTAPRPASSAWCSPPEPVSLSLPSEWPSGASAPGSGPRPRPGEGTQNLLCAYLAMAVFVGLAANTL